MKDTERRFILLQLWLLREPERRNSRGVLAFYGSLNRVISEAAETHISRPCGVSED